ncbi:MAG: hypothetical protein M0P71_10155 [Melioribacteraceae bacterium]|nr:hypothetical protein [Melioribacteraceae bacterium]
MAIIRWAIKLFDSSKLGLNKLLSLFFYDYVHVIGFDFIFEFSESAFEIG